MFRQYVILIITAVLTRVGHLYYLPNYTLDDTVDLGMVGKEIYLYVVPATNLLLLLAMS